MKKSRSTPMVISLVLLFGSSCSTSRGPEGAAGSSGAPGAVGPAGSPGPRGAPGPGGLIIKDAAGVVVPGATLLPDGVRVFVTSSSGALWIVTANTGTVGAIIYGIIPDRYFTTSDCTGTPYVVAVNLPAPRITFKMTFFGVTQVLPDVPAFVDLPIQSSFAFGSCYANAGTFRVIAESDLVASPVAIPPNLAGYVFPLHPESNL